MYKRQRFGLSDHAESLVSVCLLWSSTQFTTEKKFSVRWVNIFKHPSPLLPSAGRGFGPTEGAAQCPHDSGAASGIFVHLFQGSSWTLGALKTWNTYTMSFHSLPELGCPLMPFVSRAQTRRWHPSPSPWSNHGKSFWVIIPFPVYLYLHVCRKIYLMTRAVLHNCIWANHCILCSWMVTVQAMLILCIL